MSLTQVMSPPGNGARQQSGETINMQAGKREEREDKENSRREAVEDQ